MFLFVFLETRKVYLSKNLLIALLINFLARKKKFESMKSV